MKKDKTNLHLHLLLVFVWAQLLLAGCTKEPIQELVSEAPLAFKIDSRAIGDVMDGVTIHSLRMLVVNPNTGNRIVVNRLIDNQNESPGDFVFQLMQGRYTIAVVANETAPMSAALAAAGTLSELDAITFTTPAKEADVVLYKAVDIQLRPLASDLRQAEVSVDGGIHWLSPPTVHVELERVASKISLAIKKMTTVAGDKFDIKKVELKNLAADSHLLPGHVYTGALQVDTPFNASPGVSFANNNETKPIFENYIVPEYLLAAPASSDEAAALVITADYTKAGNVSSRQVVYTVPVLGLRAADYSLIRNRHYKVTATITQSAEAASGLLIEYEVVKWIVAGNGSFEAGAVTFSGKWEAGTSINQDVIAASNSTSVTYEFALSFPPGAQWSAQLTNFQDFDFDLNNNGVRDGITAEGIVYRIRIRPRAAVYTNDVVTEFYVTVFNGMEHVELNLTGKGTGKGNRFMIKQNPN